ncbi:MAG: SPOR domain-containing protein [Bacteroidales bacterium]|jgi:hypothetical protein|nr:SPOR domain-containing protein [Bacteroidales bacterium]
MLTFFCLFALLNLNVESTTIVKDSRVDRLVEKHIEHNKTTPINGFRINIFFQSGNHSRGNAGLIQSAFSENFPNMKSYVKFEEPYFRVNVGNFRTRLEASAALESLKMTYPQAYVVRDVLNIRDLLGIIPVSEEEEEEDNF